MFGKNGPSFFELLYQALCSTREGYNLLAPKFDATPFRTPDVILDHVMSELGSCDSALDLCCGTGAAMQRLKPLCKKRLVGIDFSPGMLKKAAENMVSTSGDAAVSFVEGDVLTMPFSQEFDVATCFGALGHILPEDQIRFLRGIRAALKPGGRFVFVTAYHPQLFSLPWLIFGTFDFVMRIRNALIKPPFIMYYLNFLLPEIGTVLKAEGFAVDVRNNFFPVPFERNSLVIATKLR